MTQENKQRNKKIMKMRKRGLSYRGIAKVYCLNHKTIYEIIKRKENNPVDNSPHLPS